MSTLRAWPSANGGRVQLSAWIFPTSNSDAARTSSAFGEQYDGNINSAWNDVPTGDQPGTLRIARRGAVMTAYA